jgi:iron complex outermembrane receptor protein
MGANLDDGRGNVVLSIGKTTADPVTQGAASLRHHQPELDHRLGHRLVHHHSFRLRDQRKGDGGTERALRLLADQPGHRQAGSACRSLQHQSVELLPDRPGAHPGYALANYKINDYVEAYAEVFYTSSKVSSTLAESGTFGNVLQRTYR